MGTIGGDIKQISSDLWDCKLPTKEDAKLLLNKAKEILTSEPTILKLNAPITVCGDIHGQFYDLLELFAVGGRPPEQNFIFLGDYVDRGYYSTETFFLLLSLKILYPRKIYLLRGNHESQQVTEDYGFYEEIIRKYNDTELYHQCIEVFNALPLSATINKSILCVHGGLSPDLKYLSDISDLDRFQEPPQYGLFSDILWSDPDDRDGFNQSPRGAGYVFGGDVTKAFLQQNELQFICRAHQVANDGYEKWFNGLLYTVWSAPNYCYRGGNLASIFEITTPTRTKFKLFKEAPASARGNIPQTEVPRYFV
ncbi:Serine/threonine-protein phosphatase PP-X isozyme 2 [Histomonas meleagridis]|uniref:Serine/threonine-protein phosphatase PP-X isozyme 2 n=1 Tax=Histomonas meleagridis TaxID=135588 RepID=UPI00355A72B8|nr:Serine/threonine-protein phosphatase PP-X isozyme 2 [Histomonas meleagridis]KAH0805640.1 Serine/threonine-protein phosphatase PP-X isozyme 2 [Histomonas meleagridis]